MENINYKQKIYAFYMNLEYHLITRINKDKYGIIPLFTDSYGVEEVESDNLEETIELCKKYWKVVEFDTYKEFFKWCLMNEENIDFMDIWGVKDVTGRHFYIEEHGDKIQKFREKNNYNLTMKVPDYS